MNNKYKVLGINYGHDSSASIGIDGEIIAACEQERYDLKKNINVNNHLINVE